jgi:hypothetical protein
MAAVSTRTERALLRQALAANDTRPPVVTCQDDPANGAHCWRDTGVDVIDGKLCNTRRCVWCELGQHKRYGGTGAWRVRALRRHTKASLAREGRLRLFAGLFLLGAGLAVAWATAPAGADTGPRVEYHDFSPAPPGWRPAP